MGRKDKHKLGSTRNNPLFKVVGGKASKAKAKPREVDLKLKKITVSKKEKQSQNISDLDAQLTVLQHGQVTFRAKEVPKKKVEPIKSEEKVQPEEVDSIADIMDNMSAEQSKAKN